MKYTAYGPSLVLYVIVYQCCYRPYKQKIYLILKFKIKAPIILLWLHVHKSIMFIIFIVFDNLRFITYAIYYTSVLCTYKKLPATQYYGVHLMLLLLLLPSSIMSIWFIIKYTCTKICLAIFRFLTYILIYIYIHFPKMFINVFCIVVWTCV